MYFVSKYCLPLCHRSKMTDSTVRAVGLNTGKGNLTPKQEPLFARTFRGFSVLGRGGFCHEIVRKAEPKCFQYFVGNLRCRYEQFRQRLPFALRRDIQITYLPCNGGGLVLELPLWPRLDTITDKRVIALIKTINT